MHPETTGLFHALGPLEREALQTPAMDLEASLLKAIDDAGEIADSGDFAASMSSDHLAVVGVIKSLQASEMILVKASGHGTHTANLQACMAAGEAPACFRAAPASMHCALQSANPLTCAPPHPSSSTQDIDHFKWTLTEEAERCLAAGASPEAQVFAIVPAEGLPLAKLKVGR
jgi:hypothetical protein